MTRPGPIKSECKNCEKEIFLWPYQLKKGAFCSLRCVAIATHTGRKMPNTTREAIRKANTGREMPPQVAEALLKSSVGRVVGKETRKKLSQAATGRIFSLETRVKISKTKRGALNYNWNPNREEVYSRSQERRTPEYLNWMKDVKNRDMWKCRIANADCEGRLEAHHILSWSEHPELRYEVNNGITLCHFHHPRVRKEEKRLAPMFKELVSVSSNSF